ncbi:esterase-like activity of phytase family protein [Sphingomonas sanxanigenens]|uniref:Phytase-like domain-containing protein n=1 Tax=Sphingomonas sanxanigenens DSM 19645 = NX02 TaxID=1123269 RepID=W0AD18_9SPHN|nr:esterase-like activity of phytase family protein [Sphingomonas sanxanigenens]AHE55804.1 hypothetical protein NX02_20815 [Sphingomonas sanxanigenens DSM 19645 = NX02]
MKRAGALALVLLLTAAPASADLTLRFAGRNTVLPRDPVLAKHFGGISGVDRDARGRWYLISDDRSERAPARIYTARFRVRRGQPQLDVRGSVALRDAAGVPFVADGRTGEKVDAEAIRVWGRTLVWSSEGDPDNGTDPAVRRMGRDGRERARIPLPEALRFDPERRHGARRNQTVEGLAVTPSGALWIAMEGPLYEDGPAATVDKGALLRFTRRARDGTTRQITYRTDPDPAAGSGRRSDIGVSEILPFGEDRLLVLERAGAEQADGKWRFRCRLYLIDTAGSGEVAKTLLVDFDSVPGGTPGNLEAMAWAPKGRLVLMADNNFVEGEPTTLLMFEVAGR